jgi:hypothetical protein
MLKFSRFLKMVVFGTHPDSNLALRDRACGHDR